MESMLPCRFHFVFILSVNTELQLLWTTRMLGKEVQVSFKQSRYNQRNLWSVTESITH